MSPLDDELRRALSQKASLLEPAPDPLAGIEARARGIRRRRAMTSVAGAALAVAAIAVAVPILSDGRPTGAPDQFVSPSVSPAADPTTWQYRGNDIPAGTLDTYRREFEIRHPGRSFVPLFGQVYEPSATQELVFTSGEADEYGSWRVGVVRSSEAGPDFVYDEGRSPFPALAFLLPGDETARLLVVAAPDSTDLTASEDARSKPFTPLTSLAPGVATGPVSADRATVTVRLQLADGTSSDVKASDNLRQPENLLTWPSRGDASAGPSIDDLKAAFAGGHGWEEEYVEYRPLFTGSTGSGVRFTVGQAWFKGRSGATTVSYATGTTQGAVLRQYYYSPEAHGAVVALVENLPGTSTDLLVVVPQPGTGQVSYSPEATGSFRPVTGQDHLDGVALIDRVPGVKDDRLELLDGDGDLDKPLYRGRVASFFWAPAA